MVSLKIKEARKLKKMTQKDLSILINRSVHTVKKYEAGQIAPPPHILEKLKTALGLHSNDELLTSAVIDLSDFVNELDEKQKQRIEKMIRLFIEFSENKIVSKKCP